MKNTNKKLGILASIAAEVLFGFSFLFTKTATESVSTLSLLSWRFLLALLGMWILAKVGVFKLNFRGKNIRRALIPAIFHPVCYFLCENNGIRLTSASESGIIIATIPVFTIIFAIGFLKQLPTKKQLVGIFLTVIGVILTVLAQWTKPTFNLTGYLLLFGCVVAYCFFAVFAYTTEEFSSTEKAFMMMVTGSIVFTTLALIEHARLNTLDVFIRLPFTNPVFLKAILYLGIASSIIAFSCNNIALENLGTTGASSFAALSTLISVAAGVVFLKEPFSLFQIVGMVLILVGVFIANRGENQESGLA